MANEAVIVDLGPNGGSPYQFTVADGATIEKGTLLKFTDPRTAAANSAIRDRFAGIAAAEKVASDGATTLAVYTEGIFDLNIVGGVVAGDTVILSGANTLRSGAGLTAASGEMFVGIALEDAAVTAETILVKLRGY